MTTYTVDNSYNDEASTDDSKLVKSITFTQDNSRPSRIPDFFGIANSTHHKLLHFHCQIPQIQSLEYAVAAWDPYTKKNIDSFRKDPK